ncbi:hypothetical protein [Saccharospirillum impatiens]|uniref:hypothetical protein n=1 Tax=Saccharospirillum impatiens TaxID=169438 RepID=UPI00048D52EC|nr:hypothetical protein [Saccharospirillum impatiens]
MSQLNMNNSAMFQAYRSAFLLGTASTRLAEPSSIPERYRDTGGRIRSDRINLDARSARAQWLKSLFIR